MPYRQSIKGMVANGVLGFRAWLCRSARGFRVRSPGQHQLGDSGAIQCYDPSLMGRKMSNTFLPWSRWHHILLLGILLPLVACGGGSGGGASPPPVPDFSLAVSPMSQP